MFFKRMTASTNNSKVITLSKNSKFSKIDEIFSKIQNIDIDCDYFDVNLMPSDDDQCHVSGEILEELFDYVEITNTDESLKIITPRLQNFRGDRAGRLDIKIKNLNKLLLVSHNACTCAIEIPVESATIESHGFINCTISKPIQTLCIESHGSGRYSIEAPIGVLSSNFRGSSKIDINDVGKATATINGSGKININSVGSYLKGDIAGTGDININDGDFELLELNIRGTGQVKANATVENANLIIAGSGSIFIDRVIGECNQSIRGSGKIDIKQRG